MDAWIGEAVGKMHMNGITQKMIAEKMCVTADYISMIFRGVRSPKNAKQRVNQAIYELIESAKR